MVFVLKMENNMLKFSNCAMHIGHSISSCDRAEIV